MFRMRPGAVIVLCCLLFATGAFAQNWKQVHKKDEAKWEKTTGLYSVIIHKLWRSASNFPDEKDDDSRIANLDLDGLAERHHVLLVTYAGEKNCLTVTVFNRLSESKFEKLWSVEQPPDGSGFCDGASGTAQAEAANGVINVRVPRAKAGGGVDYMVYSYEWNGITYRLASKHEERDR
ncbi:MAG: hypothetical protein WA655_05415 [Candidatus Korobacteraceae bacterium]